MLDWSTHGQHDDGQTNGDSENGPVSQPTGHPEHRADPNGCSGRLAGDMSVRIVQNDARTQKADPGKNTLQDAADRIWIDRFPFARKSECDDGGNGRAETDQSMGAQASRLAVQVAIQTERASKNESRT